MKIIGTNLDVKLTALPREEGKPDMTRVDIKGDADVDMVAMAVGTGEFPDKSIGRVLRYLAEIARAR
jgi:hypothetical protein